jgi:hypothetical protein
VRSKNILLFTLVLIGVLSFAIGGISAQPTEWNLTTAPIYLPQIEDDPDEANQTRVYSMPIFKANEQGFFSNYTNMFHWFGDMGINAIIHAGTWHDVMGYAFSPDGLNWVVDADFAENDAGDETFMYDFYVKENGYFDVVLENNGRYFWIVSLSKNHGLQYPIYARYGRLEKNGSVTWMAGVQTAYSGVTPEGWSLRAPICAEVDSEGRLYISFNAYKVIGTDQYHAYCIYNKFFNGSWGQRGYAIFDGLLDYNKNDDYLMYPYLNRLLDEAMAWSCLYRSAVGRWRLDTVIRNGSEGWIINNQKRMYASLADESDAHRKVDIVSYGNQLIGAYTRRELGQQYLKVEDYYINVGWSNETDLITTYPEMTGTYVPQLTTTTDGNAVLWIYENGGSHINYTYRFSNYTWNPTFTTMFNDSEALYLYNRFSFQDQVENFMPFWFQDNKTNGFGVPFHQLAFDYFSWNGSMLPLLFEHLNTTLYNSDGSVNDGWIFEGEVYTLESYIAGATDFYVNTSDSRHGISFHWSNATGEQWIEVDPGDQFTIGLAHSEVESIGNITRLLWRFIPDRSIIDAQNQTWGYYIYDETFDVGASGVLGFTTNIYNLGGTTYYTFTGDGGHVTGGQPFELYATNGTDGSSARAEQIYRKLQSVHFLIEIDMDNEWEVGNGEFDIDPGVGFVDIGIDYWLNGTWELGHYVRLFVQDADVGHHAGGNDQNWVDWSTSWYNYNPTVGSVQNIITEEITSNHWGYENENLSPDYWNRTSCQLWVDLWFDRTNASTTIAGQVNSMFHGMREHGSAWWFGYGVFQPMISEYGNTLFLDDLYDEGRNVTDSMKFDLMRLYIEVGKVSSVDGDDETWTVRAVENFNRKEAEDRMQGVEQPSFEPTLVLDMPVFQSNNPLIRAIDGISASIWKGALGFHKILWGALDTFFEWAGFGPGFFSLVTNFVLMIPDIFVAFIQDLGEILSATIPLFEEMFRFFAKTAPFAIEGLMWLAGSLTEYWDYFQQIMTGSGPFSNIGNIIEDMSLGAWLRAGIAMLPAYELLWICFDKSPIRRARRRVKFYTGLFTGITKFVEGMVKFLQGAFSVIMDFVPG